VAVKGFLGKKIGMTQVFVEDGTLIPVTVIQSDSCVVLQKKDNETDGYEAIQLGFADKKVRPEGLTKQDTKRSNFANQPEVGHAKKAGVTPKRFVKEIKGVDIAQFEVGQSVSVDIFAAGEFVDVTGTSKGKGFAGSIKRHGISRGPMAHGSRYHRGPGSMGSIQANRVPKGKRLPGHMGVDTVTVQNLQVIKVDAERNVILVKGAIPGPNNSYVTVKSSIKKQ
jgi:large subunit ribosomal protein L3